MAQIKWCGEVYYIRCSWSLRSWPWGFGFSSGLTGDYRQEGIGNRTGNLATEERPRVVPIAKQIFLLRPCRLTVRLNHHPPHVLLLCNKPRRVLRTQP